MMKKTKAFNVGDKVFAKVKGYPAWPAKVNLKAYKIVIHSRTILDCCCEWKEI